MMQKSPFQENVIHLIPWTCYGLETHRGTYSPTLLIFAQYLYLKWN